MPLEEIQQREQVRLVWSSFFNSRFHPNQDISIRDIDYELGLLDEFRSLAKRQRNSRALACRLPVELLSAIFAHLRHMWLPRALNTHEEGDGGSETGDEESETGDEESKTGDEESSDSYASDDDDTRYDFGWITVTHVCNLWRKIALSTPALWNPVHCANLSPCHREIVSHNAASSSVPLKLVFDYTEKPRTISSLSWTTEWLTPLICERLGRLELSNLPLSTNRFMDVLHALHDLPLLTQLYIRRKKGGYGKPEPAFIDFPLPIPSPQRLERVSFYNCFPPLSSPLYSSNLTHLSLELIYKLPHTEMPGVDALMTILSTMHRLEELKLDSVPIPSLSSPTSSSNTVIYNLPPSFRSFSYTAYGESIELIVGLLSQLSFPPRVNIFMELDLGGNEEETDAAFVRIAETVFRSIDASYSSTYMLQVDLWSICIVLNKTLRTGAPISLQEDWMYPLHRSVQGEGPHVHLKRVTGRDESHAMSVLRLLPVMQLTCLILDARNLEYCFPLDSGSPFVPELEHMHSLTHISVTLPSASSFFDQIGGMCTVGAQTVPKLFPNLESITLQREVKETALDSDLPKDELEQDLSAFSQALHARQWYHTSIHQLFVNKDFERAYDWDKIPRTLYITFFEWPPS